MTGSLLKLEPIEFKDGRVHEGRLIDDAGNEFPIKGFIPRFVSPDNYCRSFTVEWNKWRDIISNYIGYEERFVKETKWPFDLSGDVILEAWCGSGAFTDHMLKTGAMVVSFDFSTGVDTKYERNGSHPNLLVVQASIFDMPFAPNFFDRVFCFGVIQHTPNPRGGFNELIEVLKSGGSIAADIYLDPPDWAYLECAKYFWRRRLAGRYDPDKLRGYVEAYVRTAWPMVQLIERTPLRTESMGAF